MDFISSLVSTSSESSCDESTGPTTPDGSPLFCPVLADDIIENRLSHFLGDSRQLEVQNSLAPPKKLLTADDNTASHAMRHICVIGAGYVGGPTAAVVALHNPSIRVEVLDRDQRRLQRWNSPHLPIHEPGLTNVVRITRDGAYTSKRTDQQSTKSGGANTIQPGPNRLSNLFFTSDTKHSISKADVVFLAVNTPTKTFGLGAGRATNMTALDSAVKDVATFARPGTIIVEKSTVPCGTAQRIRQMLHALRPGVPFEVLSNPEFLSEGTAIENLMKPDRVIIGSSNTASGHLAARALGSVYASWVPTSRILEINAWSSELCKLVANAMLAQRISSINSISAICESTGADVGEIAKSIGQDPRIGPQFLKAGLGFGGSCFRKDIASLTYLAESLGLDDVAHYWNQVNLMNESQRRRFARKVIQRFDENLIGKKIAILGFAFKKNTGDARESLAVDVIKYILEERPAEIAIFDPYCLEDDILKEVGPVLLQSGLPRQAGSVKVYADAYQACEHANAVLIITDCDQFRNSIPKSATANTQTPAATPSDNIYVSSGDLGIHANDVREPQNLAYIKDQSLSVNGYHHQLVSQPPCDVDCPDCKSQCRGPISREPLEWARIAYSMKEPKWAFDGRGILDVPELEELGIRVDTLGRRRPEDEQAICERSR